MTLRYIATKKPWKKQDRFNGVRYPRAYFSSLTAGELAAFGLEEFVPDPEPALDRYPTIDAAKIAMSMWIEGIGPVLRGNAPTDERLSWDAKRAEALAYLADDTSPTPILATEANITGETVSVLAAVVVVKGNAYAAIAGLIAGLRRKTEAALDATTTSAQREAILAIAQVEAQQMIASL